MVAIAVVEVGVVEVKIKVHVWTVELAKKVAFVERWLLKRVGR